MTDRKAPGVGVVNPWAKVEVKKGPDPLYTPNPKHTGALIPFAVPFSGKKAGVNVWIPGNFTHLTQVQAIQRAMDTLVEIIYLAYGDKQHEMYDLGLKMGVEGILTIVHQDGRKIGFDNYDNLGLAFRKSKPLQTHAKLKNVSYFLK